MQLFYNEAKFVSQEQYEKKRRSLENLNDVTITEFDHSLHN